jgi:hypothetical protein
MFEPIWNANYVDHVQITMAEDIGIGGRAGYYDGIGAARDVIQNHLLQLLALTAMEEPVSFEADDVRAEKRRCSRRVTLPDDLDLHTARGQYAAGWQGGEQVVGYLDEDGISPDSTTETFAAVRSTSTPGAGPACRSTCAPASGSAGGSPRSPSCSSGAAPAVRATDTEELGQNALVIRVQPDEGVTCGSARRCPAPAMEVRDVNDGLRLRRLLHRVLPEAYERLILDVLLGDPPLFPRHEEVELSWKILDPCRGLLGHRGSPSSTSRARGARAPHEMLPATDAPGGGHDRRPDRHHGRAISTALVQERHRAGLQRGRHGADPGHRDRRGDPGRRDAGRADAAREHPSRILVTILRPGRGPARLDAEVRVGGDSGPGETVACCGCTELAHHAESVCCRCSCPTLLSSSGGRAMP